MKESGDDKKKMLMQFVRHQILATVIFFGGVVSCYQGVLRGKPWLGPLVVLVIALVRFATEKDWRSDLKLLLIISVMTFALESVMIWVGVYTPAVETRLWLVAPLSPLWIFALWANFSLKVRDYMWVMRGKPILCFIVGLLFGLFIFSNSEKMGLVTLNYGKLSVLWCALAWGSVVLIIFNIAGRIFVLPAKSKVVTEGDEI